MNYPELFKPFQRVSVDCQSVYLFSKISPFEIFLFFLYRFIAFTSDICSDIILLHYIIISY